jgi:hypothetical protein
MTLAQLIEIRDAIQEAKTVLHQLRMSEIYKPDSLFDKLGPTVDKLYFPLSVCNTNIFHLTQQQVEIND